MQLIKSDKLNRGISSKEFMGVLKVSLFTQFAATLSCVIDGIFVSRYLGSDAMTAYGIAAPYFSLVAVIIFSLLIGGQVIYTAKIGQNRKSEARGAFGLTLWLALGLAALLTVIGVVFANPIAALLGANGEAASLRPLTVQYLRMLFLGTVFNAFITLSSPAVQLDGYGKLVKWVGIIVCVADIVGDAASVFIFKGGLLGIGIATAIGYVIGAAVIGSYYFKKDKTFCLNPKVVDFSYLRRLLKNSYSQALFFICTFIAPAVINNLIIANAGIAAMAAIAVERNAAMFFNTLCYALADTVFLLTGLHYGEMDKQEVETVRKTAYSLVKLPIVLLGAAIALASALITNLYITDSADPIFQLTKLTIIALGISIPMSAVFNVSLKRLQAFGKGKYASIIAIAQALVFPVLSYAALTISMGEKGVILAITITELLSSILAFVLDCRAKKDESLFPIDESDILRVTVKKPEECAKLSMRVNGFCMLHGVDEKSSFRMSICAEDMTLAIFEQAEKLMPEGTAPFVELRLFVLNSKTTMILKDNCPQVNLKDKAEQWELDSENPEAYMGARIALKMSSDLNYMQTLNTNTMIITFDNVEREEW